MQQNKKITLNQRGLSHLFLPLTLFVITAITMTYMMVANQGKLDLAAATTATSRAKSCSKNYRYLDGACVRVYTYKRINKNQEATIKQIAAKYWFGTCAGTTGKDLKIKYYWGALRLPNIQDKYDYVEALEDWGVDAIAYTYLESETCYIYINEAVMTAKMRQGVTYSTKRSICFTMVHEVGHLAGRGDIKYGNQKDVSLSSDYIMSYDWIDRMEDGRYRTGGPAGCQRMK